MMFPLCPFCCFHTHSVPSIALLLPCPSCCLPPSALPHCWGIAVVSLDATVPPLEGSIDRVRDFITWWELRPIASFISSRYYERLYYTEETTGQLHIYLEICSVIT